jgi:two-component system, chemotaxis family, protein-glutamate methylesterase/glutaminase
MSEKLLRVLVIDDSAIVRQTLTRLLTDLGQMQVTVAADPLIALAKMERERPDVIILDLELPRMDGLTFLAKIMTEDPLPVVICSALSAKRSEQAVLALMHGAVEIVTKPKLGVSDFLSDSATAIIDAVRSAAAARTRRHGTRPQPLAPVSPQRSPHARASASRVVAVGASTGGVEALTQLLGELPADAPGLLIVQHMPEAFTASFARRLDQLCAIEVREAAEGDPVEAGVALIGPGNRHLTLRGAPGRYRVALEDGPLVSRHRPSVDVLFHSVARTAGRDAVGVIMTGMGADGVDGMLAMRAAGASTIAQDHASCVIFGMPREAIARGAAAQIVALDDLSRAILRAAE